MEKSTKPSFKNLAEFDLAHSPSGLFKRYARGRTRAVRQRLFAGMSCGVILYLFESLFFAMIVTALGLICEVIEDWVLRRQLAVDKFSSARTEQIVGRATLVQAYGFAICIFVAGIQSNELRLMSWVFLIGALINSMLAAYYHRPSHDRRLAIFVGVVVCVLFATALKGEITGREFVIEISALVAVIVMLNQLAAHVARRENVVRVSDRTLIQRSLEAERLALIARHASDCIILMDKKLRVVWVNQQFTNVTGFTLADSIGRNPGVLLNHPETSEETIAQLIAAAEARRVVNVRILNKTKSGNKIWIESHQTPVIDDNGELSAFIAVERDVSDLVAREQQLHVALVAAQEADKEKTAFLSRMSHELRTPANGIYGSYQILKDTDLSTEQEDAIEILQTSTDRLMGVVENVLTISGDVSENVEVNFESRTAEEILARVVKLHSKNAESKGIALSVEVDESARRVWHTDPAIVHGVLDKLVDNAIKFTNEGKIYLQAKVDDNDVMHIAVEDTGVGIASDKLSVIFNAFEQVDEADTRSFDGVGLGLPTAKNLANLLGGQIRVRSELGKGSRFKVKFPFVAVSEPDKAAPPPNSNDDVVEFGVLVQGIRATDAGTQDALELDCARDSHPASAVYAKGTKADGSNEQTHDVVHDAESEPQMQLLVAEDNRTNRLLIKAMLKSAGHNIDFAEDGVQAVEKYKISKPDVVLMDLSMPNKNGLDATREIREMELREHLPRCPIVAVTANVTDDDRKKCFDAGMDGFLPKPLKKDRLLQAIADVAA